MLIRWYIFLKRLLTINIVCNFIPHKTVLIDDKDSSLDEQGNKNKP